MRILISTNRHVPIQRLGGNFGMPMHAMQVELHKQTHNKLPWIKVGDRVLSPKEVRAVYAELKGQKGA
jgi:hypothetical protein